MPGPRGTPNTTDPDGTVYDANGDAVPGTMPTPGQTSTGKKPLELRDFQGSQVFIDTGNGYLPATVSWTDAGVGAPALSGWSLVTADGQHVPMSSNPSFVTSQGTQYTFSAQNGTLVDQKDLTAKQLAGDGVGGTGGTGGSATPYGYSAPDPTAAASIIHSHYQDELDAGKITVDQAKDAFDREWNAIVSNSNIDSSNVSNKLTADTTNATVGTRYMEAGQTRAANIASSQGNLDQQATERAKILAALLPTRLPDGVGMTVQGAGVVPINHTNIDQLLNQGLPSLASQYGGLQTLFPQIGQAPVVTPDVLGHIAMPSQPPVWTPPPPTNVDALINAAMSGSPPMGWA